MTGSATVGSGPTLPRPGSIVDIHYRRIGRTAHVYRQFVLETRPDVVVTLQPRTPIDRPLVVDGLTILEPRSPVIWFSFVNKWHDIGLFHRTNGAFTGIYGNILTPLEFVDGNLWATTDLCLDIWMPRWGSTRLLDEDELDAAESGGRIDPELAARARAEAKALMHACRAGAWPPPMTGEWSLVRALKVCSGMG
ncbi:MAG: DUF402 domain-containing protein [Gemmatimonadota bacterium]|nr:DUF402 domain-containing protein [bacterium]MDE2874515.1 DUF402 domain-containing protein [Gemmatimonadota bacterium]